MDKDRPVSIETISAHSDASAGTVHTIIREELKMRKICAKFGPCTSPQLYPYHRLFDQDGHEDCSSPSL